MWIDAHLEVAADSNTAVWLSNDDERGGAKLCDLHWRQHSLRNETIELGFDERTIRVRNRSSFIHFKDGARLEVEVCRMATNAARRRLKNVCVLPQQRRELSVHNYVVHADRFERVNPRKTE